MITIKILYFVVLSFSPGSSILLQVHTLHCNSHQYFILSSHIEQGSFFCNVKFPIHLWLYIRHTCGSDTHWLLVRSIFNMFLSFIGNITIIFWERMLFCINVICRNKKTTIKLLLQFISGTLFAKQKY